VSAPAAQGEAARLARRARAELPRPGDPQLLLDDLLAADLHGPEALALLGCTRRTHEQLRDLALEAAWQRGFGWFLARNLMLFGLLSLGLALAFSLDLQLYEAGLAGAGLCYLLGLLLMPLRLRRHRRRRAAILEAHARTLQELIARLEGAAAPTAVSPRPAAPAARAAPRTRG